MGGVWVGSQPGGTHSAIFNIFSKIVLKGTSVWQRRESTDAHVGGLYGPHLGIEGHNLGNIVQYRCPGGGSKEHLMNSWRVLSPLALEPGHVPGKLV